MAEYLNKEGLNKLAEVIADKFATKDTLNSKQDTLVSGTNIKTINNTSILGSGNISISGGAQTDVQINGTSITSNNVANIITNTAYNSNTNKIATMSDVPDVSGKQNTLQAKGSTTKPIYVSSAGTISETNTYAGGTAVTLNGTSKAATTASFYAPTSAISTSTAKRYLVGSSSTTSVATENTNENCYMQDGKLYAQDFDLTTTSAVMTLNDYNNYFQDTLADNLSAGVGVNVSGNMISSPHTTRYVHSELKMGTYGSTYTYTFTFAISAGEYISGWTVTPIGDGSYENNRCYYLANYTDFSCTTGRSPLTIQSTSGTVTADISLYRSSNSGKSGVTVEIFVTKVGG